MGRRVGQRRGGGRCVCVCGLRVCDGVLSVCVCVCVCVCMHTRVWWAWEALGEMQASVQEESGGLLSTGMGWGAGAGCSLAPGSG